MLTALKVNLVKEEGKSVILFRVKGDTSERQQLMKVIDHIDGGTITHKHKSLYVKKFVRALIFPGSDLIIINGEAVLYKSEYIHSRKIISLDKDILQNKNDVLFIKKPKKIIEIYNGFSLCGVHSDVWSHFLVQYMPKISLIRRIIDCIDEDLIIVVPEYFDANIKEIIQKYFAGIERVSIVMLKNGEAAKCENLYFIDNTSIITEHSKNISPSDIIIPQFVRSFLKNEFIKNESLFPSAKDPTTIPFRKLYITRIPSKLSPLSNMRVLRNNDKVEDFFKTEGFELIVPHEYSLDEKRKLFNEASIIVGPYSSGFMNIMFCQPGTKIMIFTNFQRIYELYLAALAECFELTLVALTGIDEDPCDIHTSFSIPLQKIKDSYKNHI